MDREEGLIVERTFTYSYEVGEVVQARFCQYEHAPDFAVMDFEFKGQPIRVPWHIQVQVFDTVANKDPMHYVDRSDDKCTILWFPFKIFLEISYRDGLLASAKRGIQTLADIATYKAVVPTFNGYYEVLIPR